MPISAVLRVPQAAAALPEKAMGAMLWTVSDGTVMLDTQLGEAGGGASVPSGRTPRLMGRGAAQQQQKGMERADARLHLRERDIVHKYKPRSDRHTARDAAAPSELSSSLLVISARHLRSNAHSCRVNAGTRKKKVYYKKGRKFTVSRRSPI